MDKETLFDKKLIEQGVSLILKGLGEDVNREGLIETPKRVARAYEELCRGYEADPKIILGRVFSEEYDEMVIMRDLSVFSLCEHHLLPFFGKACIAYIPNGKVVGISKLSRLLAIYMRRLQLQERLTQQIADALQNELNPKGVGVVIEATHFCMTMRGTKEHNSVMITSALRGVIKEQPETRAEFLKLMDRQGTPIR